MKNPQQYKQIEDKIKELVPSIMELKFWCKFRAIKEIVEEAVYGIVISGEVSYINSKGGHSKVDTSFIYYNKDLFEIIGRPITLNDLLLAIGSRRLVSNYIIDDMKLSDRGKTLDIKVWGKSTKDGDTTFLNYDLTKPFNEQSDEFYDFISNLICK